MNPHVWGIAQVLHARISAIMTSQPDHIYKLCLVSFQKMVFKMDQPQQFQKWSFDNGSIVQTHCPKE